MEWAEAICRQENWHFDDASVRPYIRSTAHGFSYYRFRADYALVQDKAFKKHAMAYAADEALFFKELVLPFTLARLHFVNRTHVQFLRGYRQTLRTRCPRESVGHL